MKNRTSVIVLLVMAATLGLMGCGIEQEPMGGVVELNRDSSVGQYDADFLAWKGFGSPPPDTILLINESGRIVESERDMSTLAPMASRARRMAEAVEEANVER